MVVVFQERLHPRDGLGRFRNKLRFEIDENDTYAPPTHERMMEMSEEFEAGTSANEAGALRNYTLTAEIINPFMRGKPVEESFYPDEIESAKTNAELATDAIDGAPLPENVVLYRAFHDAELNQLALEGKLIGTRVTDDGFMSMTTDPSWMSNPEAFDAVEPGSAVDNVNPADLPDNPVDMYSRTHAVMVVRVPKGARAAPLSTISAFPYQDEMLLQSGSTVEITGAEYVPNDPADPKAGGTIAIAADLIQQLGGDPNKEAEAQTDEEVFRKVVGEDMPADPAEAFEMIDSLPQSAFAKLTDAEIDRLIVLSERLQTSFG